eukprot:gene9098-biopygen7671
MTSSRANCPPFGEKMISGWEFGKTGVPKVRQIRTNSTGGRGGAGRRGGNLPHPFTWLRGAITRPDQKATVRLHLPEPKPTAKHRLNAIPRHSSESYAAPARVILRARSARARAPDSQNKSKEEPGVTRSTFGERGENSSPFSAYASRPVAALRGRGAAACAPPPRGAATMQCIHQTTLRLAQRSRQSLPRKQLWWLLSRATHHSCACTAVVFRPAVPPWGAVLRRVMGLRTPFVRTRGLPADAGGEDDGRVPRGGRAGEGERGASFLPGEAILTECVCPCFCAWSCEFWRASGAARAPGMLSKVEVLSSIWRERSVRSLRNYKNMLHRESRLEADSEPNCIFLAALGRSEPVGPPQAPGTFSKSGSLKLHQRGRPSHSPGPRLPGALAPGGGVLLFDQLWA